jgi:hypothetical protein
MITFSELERIVEETVMAYIKVLFQHSPRQADINPTEIWPGAPPKYKSQATLLCILFIYFICLWFI